MYDLTGSYVWSYACSGLLLFPLVPYLYYCMPETVPLHLRKPFSWAAVGEAFRSQVTKGGPHGWHVFSALTALWPSTGSCRRGHPCGPHWLDSLSFC